MFTQIIKELKTQFPNMALEELIYYFDRQIELDTDEHGPMSFEMINYLCADDDEKWNDVLQISIQALKERIKLWDAIEYEIENK